MGEGGLVNQWLFPLGKRKRKVDHFSMFVAGKAQWRAIVLRGRGLFVLSAPDEIGYWVES